MNIITCFLLLSISLIEGASFIVPSATRHGHGRRSGCLVVAPPKYLLNEKSTYSADIPYEILPIQNVIDTLTQTDNNDNHLTTGLSDEEAAYLLAQVGPNALQAPRKTSIWELCLQQFDGECSWTISAIFDIKHIRYILWYHKIASYICRWARENPSSCGNSQCRF